MQVQKGPRQVDEHSLKAENYRARSSELTEIAKNTNDAHTKNMLQGLADEYLKMASQRDQIAAINRQLRDRGK